VLTLDLLSAELISVYDHAEHDHQANKNEKKSKSNQMLLLVKSALSLSYSGRRERRRGRPGNRLRQSRGYPMGTKYYICNQEDHWTSECPTNKSNNEGSKRETPQFRGFSNIAIDHLQSLGEWEVGKMLIVTYNSFPSTGILLDCSATAHMFTNKQYFSTYVNSIDEFVTVGGHNCIPVAGQGSAHFSTVL